MHAIMDTESAIELKEGTLEMSDPTPSWLSAAITGGIAVVTAIWAFLRHMFVTRREMEDYFGQAEARFEHQVNEMKQTILELHDDNKTARHRLRNDINTPLTNLAANFEGLRQELVRQRQHDARERQRHSNDAGKS